MSGLDEEYRKEFHTGNQGGVVLDNEEFVIRIPEYGTSKRLRDEPMQDLSEISKKVCNVYQVAESFINADNRSQFASKIRSLAALLHSEQSGSITRVAEYVEKEISTLSKNLKKLKQKLLVDSQLRQEVETLKNPKIQASSIKY